jgi:hypothetical protein
VNVCKGCDWLCTTFRLALLERNFDHAVALYSTGNVNINSPFANVKGELFFPVHCAVLGGNLELLKWLVDVQGCPIKSVRITGSTRAAGGNFTQIVTSKGRTLLGIALQTANTAIVRYLVVEKGISLEGEKDVTLAVLIRNLYTVLRLLPEDARDLSATTRLDERLQIPTLTADSDEPPPPLPDQSPFNDSSHRRTLTQEAFTFGAVINDAHNSAQEGECCDDECKYRSFRFLYSFGNNTDTRSRLLKASFVVTIRLTVSPTRAGTKSCV